jgi:pre-mRNA-processing factor 17
MEEQESIQRSYGKIDSTFSDRCFPRFLFAQVSGYACGLDFSPDMSYVVSGDADGRLMIWDWKTTRLFEQIKAHDDVCIDAKWHWHEKSRVLTAGWDNVVKLWD